MFESLKQLFRRPAAAPTWVALERWAQSRGFAFRRTRDHEGFAIEGRFEDQPWRLEWGPSQRDYFPGRELRLRMELDLPGAMQLLILSHELMRSMESETFERYTDHMQTQVHVKTPEEMRWLVMHPKLGLRPLPTLRAHIGAVGQPTPCLARWLEGPLAAALEVALQDALSEGRAFVLMVLRGRVSLRVSLDKPTPLALTGLLALFQTAVEQTPQAVEGLAVSSSEWARASGWQSVWHDDTR